MIPSTFNFDGCPVVSIAAMTLRHLLFFHRDREEEGGPLRLAQEGMEFYMRAAARTPEAYATGVICS